ncbi:MAG: hypothetical protein GMKNLPBB_03358 [Myxococcota bacterium]|nr:hypothetical protein [Myxococcota bacterium]
MARGRALFFSRIAFILLGVLILLNEDLQAKFGAGSPAGWVWLLFMATYAAINIAVLDRAWLGKAVTVVTLGVDLATVIYMIGVSGGLYSPVLPTQIISTIFFALLFPRPIAILPPLLALPLAALQIVYSRTVGYADSFLLLYYSALNLIVVYVIVYLNQREEASHAELLRLQRNQRDLAVAEERNRLAREIHDGVGAALTGLIIQAEYLKSLSQDPELTAELKELRENAELTADELRRSISMMRDDFQLVPALEDYCLNLGQKYGLKVEFEVHGLPPPMRSEVQLNLFRILQEALTNVARHAEATEARVLAVFFVNGGELTVVDDGKGINLDKLPPGHYGLTNMRERARAAGGKLIIERREPKGTIVRCSFGLQRAELKEGAVNDRKEA